LQWPQRLIDCFIADVSGREIFPLHLARQKLPFSMERNEEVLLADCSGHKRSLYVDDSQVTNGGQGLWTTAIIPKKEGTIGMVFNILQMASY
jgi:hypothetical protein